MTCPLMISPVRGSDTDDPYDHPLIQPNYLSHPDDVTSLIESYKLVYHLASTDALTNNNVRMFEAIVPECFHLFKSGTELKNGITIPTDDYLECVVRHHTRQGSNAGGACKMGPQSDSMAVVSPDLKVNKVKGLRVIDASIMPRIPYASIYATVVMIGERGAQFIIDEYKL